MAKEERDKTDRPGFFDLLEGMFSGDQSEQKESEDKKVDKSKDAGAGFSAMNVLANPFQAIASLVDDLDKKLAEMEERTVERAKSEAKSELRAELEEEAKKRAKK